jgi:hypothetical protein
MIYQLLYHAFWVYDVAFVGGAGFFYVTKYGLVFLRFLKKETGLCLSQYSP